jgi:hypothetical protein
MTPSHALRPTLVLAALAVGACGLSEKPSLPTNVVGHCKYTNKFAGGLECRDYLGTWTAAEAEADCKGQKDPAFELATACNESEILAWCLVPDEGKDLKVAFLGTDPGECGTKQTGCEVFAGGFFEPAPPCGGTLPDDGGSSTPVWQQPKLICKAPKAGEPAGKGTDGQVCTWQMISGATEEGRRYSDYADCSAVLTQRPYWPAPEDERVNTPDPRLDDPLYKAEAEWVRSQLTAGACVCCHGREAPQGASNWTVDSPNFVNGFKDRGVAMGAGWIRSVGFGAYPPEQNNGFVRPTLESPDGSIFPTTDPARMIRFWLGEAAHRGLKEEQFADQKYSASPLDDQMAYRPKDCGEGEGVGADGKLRWKFGAVRYLWVLDAEASTPGVPPNLDLPTGTMWNVYVSSDGGKPIPNGTVSYGTLPAGALQRFPADGAAPAALEAGRKYYLYALSDIGLPVTRCLFKAP